eukprot:6312772-Alexandrium_andersonii.AAC.1
MAANPQARAAGFHARTMILVSVTSAAARMLSPSIQPPRRSHASRSAFQCVGVASPSARSSI